MSLLGYDNMLNAEPGYLSEMVSKVHDCIEINTYIAVARQDLTLGCPTVASRTTSWTCMDPASGKALPARRS